MQTLTIDQAHRYFGVQYNNLIWKVLEKKEWTAADKAQAIQYGQASLLHWESYSACTNANRQRGNYMVARVYVFAHDALNALYYAQQCLHFTTTYPSEMQDFDVAYAYEIMARAYALNKNVEQGKTYYEKAITAANAIKNPKDRKIFDGDFKTDLWFGLV